MSDYYDVGGAPGDGSHGDSVVIRNEFKAVQDGISKKLPVINGNPGKVVVINAGATKMETAATTGTGDFVRGTSPTLTTPTLNSPTFTALILGTPVSGDAINLTNTIAPQTNAATSKATPVDADAVPLIDSAASFGLKKLTWANLKAVISAQLTSLPNVVSATFLPVSSASSLAASRTAMDVPSNAEVVHSGYMHIQDQKASGTSGGASTATAMTRTLNTVVRNTISGASLAANVITLPIGKYRVRAESMAVADTVASHITPYLQNTADAVKALIGVRAYTGVGMAANPTVSGSFEIVAIKTFTLINQYSAANTNGLGLPASFGYTEVYANVEIWKE